MTNITRKELEACARLLGHDVEIYDGMPDAYMCRSICNDASDREALARAAKLTLDYSANCVDWKYADGWLATLYWPVDGTEVECIIKAAAAVQLEREKP